MKIVTLLENETIDKSLKSSHGLSIYIEENNQKILFDLGPNNNYLKNAKKLGVDLKEVDTVVISHGHFDHGSGIKKFLEINKKATIYLSKDAFNKQYKKLGAFRIPIGIKKPKDLDRIVLIDMDYKINDNLKIYSDVEYVSQLIGDNSLLTKRDGEYSIDKFDHEIYLVISNKKSNVLFSGCSHKGIETIIDSIEKRTSKPFTHIIGGFHLSHYNPKDANQTTYLEKLGEKLYSNDASKYFSCHCTGNLAFDELKQSMNEKLERIKTGSILNI